MPSNATPVTDSAIAQMMARDVKDYGYVLHLWQRYPRTSVLHHLAHEVLTTMEQKDSSKSRKAG